MKITTKAVSAVSFLCSLGVIAAVAVSRDVRAASTCVTAKGTYSAAFTTQNCTAPSGLCATGTITGGGVLNGTTSWTETSQAPSAGMPLYEPSAVVSYDGTLVITTKKGTLTIHDLGVVEGSTEYFAEIDESQSGTGDFAATTNTFFITGTLPNNGTEFLGTISGEICTE